MDGLHSLYLRYAHMFDLSKSVDEEGLKFIALHRTELPEPHH